jgi:hypothetical protein
MKEETVRKINNHDQFLKYQTYLALIQSLKLIASGQLCFPLKLLCNSLAIPRKTKNTASCWWFRPIILATQEAEIRRISVRSQPGQIVCETLS